ncbi:hypothetical protein Misp02_30420 [Microtetraspora sp. NBRC 16547]|nr:hypothetical protein Misp02_30420 [Microtetraspora sp. NBRC 16547]
MEEQLGPAYRHARTCDAPQPLDVGPAHFEGENLGVGPPWLPSRRRYAARARAATAKVDSPGRAGRPDDRFGPGACLDPWQHCGRAGQIAATHPGRALAPLSAPTRSRMGRHGRRERAGTGPGSARPGQEDLSTGQQAAQTVQDHSRELSYVREMQHAAVCELGGGAVWT